MVAANTYPMVFMMRFLGPQMKNRDKSSIINLTSMYAAWGGTYQLPIFSAGKALQASVSEAVYWENERKVPQLDILTVK